MYTDIEAKINAIKTSLHAELQKLNAIDMDDRVMNIVLFEQVVKSKIDELKKLESLVIDGNGNATSRYGTNIWLNTISEFQNMLKYKSLNPQQDKLNAMQDMAEFRINRQSALHNTITKALAKLFKLHQRTGISR